MHLIAAMVDLAGPLWPAVFGSVIGLVAWLELKR